MNADIDTSYWHLDKRVPIAMIVAICLQTGGLVWWASNISERVNALERSRDSTAPQGDRLTRVEVKPEGVQSGIEEIKHILNKLPSK